MKVGECIHVRTNAELLNEVLGTHYKGFQQSSIILPDGKRLWMIELGSFVTPSGWVNKLIGTDKLSEKHVKDDFDYDRHNTYWGARQTGTDWGPETRVIFEKVTFGKSRIYIFRGVFRINREESSVKENVWDLIMSEYNF